MIGVPGATVWNPGWARHAEGYGRVYVLTDGDGPGRALAQQVVDGCARGGIQARLVRTPEGRDARDILQAEDGGAAGIARLLEQADSDWDQHQAPPPPPAGKAPPLGSLLDDVRGFLGDYVVVEGVALDEVALWIASTHVFEAFGCTPYQNIVSATPEAGKTTLLELIGLLVHRPVAADSISPAALFRAIEKWKPTVIIDEADSAVASGRADSERAETLKGLLNGGYRRTGKAIRCAPPAHEPREFSTYCPKAFAGVKSFLADSTLSRCVTITMRRKRPSDETLPYRQRTVEPRGEALRERLQEWAAAVDTDKLGQAEPCMPDELSDRAADIWEPLFAIAEHAGEEWPERARRAALQLSAGVDLDSQDEAIQLLAAIKAVFDEDTGRDAITSADLVDALARDPESPWVRWVRWWDERENKPTRKAQYYLAQELKPFKVKSRDIRTKGSGVRKGYRRDQFQDDWERLLDSDPAGQPRHPRQPSNHQGFHAPGIRDTTHLVADSETAANPAAIRVVADVAEKRAGTGKAGEAAG